MFYQKLTSWICPNYFYMTFANKLSPVAKQHHCRPISTFPSFPFASACFCATCDSIPAFLSNNMKMLKWCEIFDRCMVHVWCCFADLMMVRNVGERRGRDLWDNNRANVNDLCWFFSVTFAVGCNKSEWQQCNVVESSQRDKNSTKLINANCPSLVQASTSHFLTIKPP